MKFYSLVLRIETCLGWFLHSNMTAVCLYISHMDDYWSHHLLLQALHHHCQVGGFKCSFSACYTVSPQTATNCHCCIHIHLPAELLWGWKITTCPAVQWERSFWEVQYLSLFLMTSVVTFFFIFPFTLLLLFASCIQAPYKDKFRF